MARRKIVSKSKQQKQEEKATAEVVPIRGNKKKTKQKQEPVVIVSGSTSRKPKPLKYLKDKLKEEHETNGRSSLYQYWRRTIEKHYGVESVPTWARKKRK